MRRATITVVYTQEDQEVQYLNGNEGYEDVTYRKVVENGAIVEKQRIRDWKPQGKGFRARIPNWVIYGPKEWTVAYTTDRSPPPKEMQDESH